MSSTEQPVARFLVAGAVAGTITGYLVRGGRLEQQQVLDVGTELMALARSADGFVYAARRGVPEVVTLAEDGGGLRVIARTRTASALVYLSVVPGRPALLGASYGDGVAESLSLDADGLPVTGSSRLFAAGPNAHSVEARRMAPLPG